MIDDGLDCTRTRIWFGEIATGEEKAEWVHGRWGLWSRSGADGDGVATGGGISGGNATVVITSRERRSVKGHGWDEVDVMKDVKRSGKWGEMCEGGTRLRGGTVFDARCG